MTGELDRYVDRLEAIVGPEGMRQIGTEAGLAAKKAALSAAEDDLGPDRAMSHFRNGRVRLGAGFDLAAGSSLVTVNHRPGGLWLLADRGRQRGGEIYPRRNGRRVRSTTVGRAVRTPAGPRSSSSYGPSRGMGTVRKAAAREREAAPRAAFVQIQRRIAATVGVGASLGSSIGGG